MRKDRTGGTTTNALWQNLLRASNMRSFWEKSASKLETGTLTEFLDDMCKQRKKRRSHVLAQAGIEYAFGHQIFRGVRRPSRDKLLQLAFGFPLTPEETQRMLLLGNKRLLHPRIIRDDAVLFALTRNMSFLDAQVLLQELSLPLLGDKL